MAGYFELLKGATGAYRFNLKAGNHETILSSQTYTTKAAAKGGIESVKKNAMLDDRWERRTAKDGSPYFVLLAANKEIIGQSEMYKSASAMENGIKSVRSNAAAADFRDKTE